jgi:hypothetical protein
MSAVLTVEIKNEKLCSQTEASTKIEMHNTCQSSASVVNPIAPPPAKKPVFTRLQNAD